jgi:hypothetical protein
MTNQTQPKHPLAEVFGFLRREDENLEAAQVRQIIAAPLSTILSRRSSAKTEAGRRWMDEKCRDVEF